MEKDYAKLEGKEVICNLCDGSIYRGIVTGCDPDIGITIHDEENKEHYLICLIGPSSTLWKSHYNLEGYKTRFNMIVEMIEAGEYHGSIVVKSYSLSYYVPGKASAEHCPFGQ